ncbi:Rv3235 family protein [Streptomyces sp. NPDC047081]|uniref:Rv3235 family protein n=1 Tax=Streptomyces sp. NPDC047081 TaxID=3154706 RepID=UPI0033F1DA8E
MHKVMTRAQLQPGTRPPGRRDSRRPGGTPPRNPGAPTTRPAPGGGRPPGARGTGPYGNTRPTDGRPGSAPGSSTTTSLAHASPPGSATSRAPHSATPHNSVRPASHGAARSTSRNADRPASHPAPRSAASTALAVASPTTTRPAQPLRAPVPQPSPTDLFADRLLAVLSGQRPVHWMLRHTIGRAYDELAWLAERGPLRTRGPRPVVRDIGYCVPRPGAIEAFARIGAGDQLRAMAFRLEQGADLRWRCTAVELGGARPPLPADD